MQLIRRLSPSSLFARMALIVLVGLGTAQLVSLWLQWGERATVVSQARGLSFIDHVAETIRVLEAESPARRNEALATLQSGDLRAALIGADQVSANTPRGQIQAAIGARLGSEREIRSDFGSGVGAGMGGGMRQSGPWASSQHGSMTRTIDVRLLDGQWVRISAGHEPSAPALSNSLIASLAITFLIVIAVVMLSVRQATKPLQSLAEAADNFGRDLDAPPLAETGSAETRRASQAFNRMKARIKRLVDERARALAAVSHDLRTPLTRLRLRAELVEDDNLRDQMVSDIDSMAVMIDATLDYLRGLQDSEAIRRIDMNALLQSLAEDVQLLGEKISIEGSAAMPYTGHLSALRRALQNLIDNAIKYGNTARIRIDDTASALRIIVEDDGPGIPNAELDRVVEPYFRLEASRNRETGGVGLGLSIVKDIALLHNGDLILANRPQGGLSATLVLTRTRENSDA